MSSTNIQIAVKVRPLIEREIKDQVESRWVVKENSIVHIDSAQNYIGEPYGFDHIFDQKTTNKEIYDAVVQPLVMSCLEGMNSTIFAYGQTSSGKTHTMLGDKDIPGIIMFTVQDIFKHIEETTTKNFLLRCSYLEIYNEKINDLLDTNAKDLKIRENNEQAVYVNAKQEVIRESVELFTLMKKGMKTRKIGCTDMNERSSRSHTIFKLVIQSQNKDSEGSYTESCLSLVDLAGSERVGQMNMKGERQAEGVSINKSLTTLGLVIRKLSENEQFINYRDSKLTRLLQHSLGGNSRTLIICTITVAAAEETKSTLEFAQRAKFVKNRPKINQRVTDKDQLKQYAHLCQDYKGQIEKLRLEKLEREKTINALEDKISNIRLFTSGNVEKPVRASKIPQRRHTLGHYKPFMKSNLGPILDSGGSDESNDEGDADIIIPTLTCNDNNENLDFDTETIDSNPSEALDIPKTSIIPQTPSPTLKIQRLEESYESLKTFTSLENEVMGQLDEIMELRELTERLRDENIELRQQSIKESQQTNIIELREILDRLSVLHSIIKGKPVEEIRRTSLHTIEEENIEMITDQSDPCSNIELELVDQLADAIKKTQTAREKHLILDEENQQLRKQLEEKEHFISSINTTLKEKGEIEAEYAAAVTENKQLKSQLEIKDVSIEKLENIISQNRDVREAELEILTKKIKELNDNKEKLHKKLSELQESKELSKDECLEIQSTSYQKELQILRKECDELKQLAEYNIFKVGELEEENQMLKTNLQSQPELKIPSKENQSLEETEKEILDSRRVLQLESNSVIDLKSQLNELNSKFSEVSSQHKILEEKQTELTEQLKAFKQENDMLKLQLSLNSEPEYSNWSNLEVEISALKVVISYLSKENDILKNESDEKCSLKHSIKCLEGKNAQLQKEKDLISKEVSELKDFIILKDDKISELERSKENLSCIWNRQIQEFSSMKEKYDVIDQEQLNMEKKIEKLTQVEMEYTSLKNHVREVFGEDIDVITQINTLKALKSDNDNYKSRMGSSEQIITELNIQIDNLKKEISKLNENNIDLKNSALASEDQALTCQIENLIDLSIVSHQINDTQLELYTKKKEKDELNGQLIRDNEMINQYSVLEEENVRLKSKLDDVIFKLNEEEQDIRNKSEELDKKCSLIANLETEILQLKKQNNIFDLEKEKSLELSKDNVTLQKSLSEREEKIKKLEEKMHLNMLQFSEENKKLNNLIQSNSAKIIELDSQNLELNTQLGSLSQDYKCSNDLQQVLEQKIANLQKDNTDLQEKLQKSIDTDLRLADYIKEVNNLGNKCSNLELQLEYCREQLDNQIAELNEETVIYDNINDKCTTQELEREDQLHSSTSKKIDIEFLGKFEKLKKHINIFSQAQKENIDLQQLLTQKSLEIKNLEEENDMIKQHLDDDICLQETLDKYFNEISVLKDKCITLEAQLQTKTKELDEQTNSYNSILYCYDTKVVENECLIKENSELKKKVTTLSEEQLFADALRPERESLKYEIACLSQQVDELSNENIEMNLNLAAATSDLESREMDLQRKSEEIVKIGKEKSKLQAKLEKALNNLTDMKRQLDKRNEDLSHFKGKYNALEVQFQDSKDSLKAKIRDLEKQIRKGEQINLIENTMNVSEVLLLEEKNTELVSKLEDITLKLNQIQNENNMKTVQLKYASEEVQKLKQNILNVATLEVELDEYKKTVQKLRTKQEEKVILLKNTISQLSDEKRILQNELSESEEKLRNTENRLSEGYSQYKEEVNACKGHANVLESQLKYEKSKVESLTKKLQISESEIENLQAKVSNTAHKKKVQVSILKDTPGSRLSDEGRPLSPNELRKIKRRSIHDQRRGLLDSNESLEADDKDCPKCQNLRTKYNRYVEKTRRMLEEMEDIRKNNDYLKWENEYMTEKTREMDSKIKALEDHVSRDRRTHCSDCKVFKTKLSKIEEENKMLIRDIKDLKKENEFLDKEAADMLNIIREMEQSEASLHDQLEKCKLSGVSSSDVELRQLQTKYNEAVTKKTEIEKEVMKNKEVIKELRRKLHDYQCQKGKVLPNTEGKATLETCEFYKKYKEMKRIAISRRRENNYLRAKLNLPADCAVLPEDLERQPTNV